MEREGKRKDGRWKRKKGKDGAENCAEAENAKGVEKGAKELGISRWLISMLR